VGLFISIIVHGGKNLIYYTHLGYNKIESKLCEKYLEVSDLTSDEIKILKRIVEELKNA